MSSSRLWLLRAILFTASLVLSFGLAEILLRVAGVAYPGFYEPDSSTGAWHRPGAQGRWSSEGEAWISINSAGLRDREHRVAKGPEQFRIAILGDSYAEALQVDVESTFWAVLAQELDGCSVAGGRSVEPINFGVAGFGTVQQLVVLRTRVWRYDPDMVVLLFIPNDVMNNHPMLEGDPMRPYGRITEAGLVIDDSFRSSDEYLYATWEPVSLRRDATAHSRVLQLVEELRRVGKRRARRATGSDLQDLVYAKPLDSVWREAWNVTERALIEIANEVRDRGARFMLVVGTYGPQVHTDEEFRRHYVQETGVSDFLYPEHRLSALGEREGFDVLVLAPSMLAASRSAGRCPHGFENARPCGGHWNEMGHRVAGEMIAAYVCDGG